MEKNSFQAKAFQVVCTSSPNHSCMTASNLPSNPFQ